MPALVVVVDGPEEFHRLLQQPDHHNAWTLFVDLLSTLRREEMPSCVRKGFQRKAAGLAALHFAAAWGVSQLSALLIEFGTENCKELLGSMPYPLVPTLRGGVGAVSGALYHALAVSSVACLGCLVCVLPWTTLAELERMERWRCQGKGGGGHGHVLASLAASSLSCGVLAAAATSSSNDGSHMMHLCVLALIASWAFVHFTRADGRKPGGAVGDLFKGLLAASGCLLFIAPQGGPDSLQCAAAVVEALGSILLTAMCQHSRLARCNPDESTCLAVALSRSWLTVSHVRIVQNTIWPSVRTSLTPSLPTMIFSYMSVLFTGVFAAASCWAESHQGRAWEVHVHAEVQPGERNADAIRALLAMALVEDPAAPQNNHAPRHAAPAHEPLARGPEGLEPEGLRQRPRGVGR